MLELGRGDKAWYSRTETLNDKSLIYWNDEDLIAVYLPLHAALRRSTDHTWHLDAAKLKNNKKRALWSKLSMWQWNKRDSKSSQAQVTRWETKAK